MNLDKFLNSGLNISNINSGWDITKHITGNFAQPKVLIHLFIFELFHVIITASKYRVAGFSDMEKQIPLSTKHLLMQGSVGKTYVAAIAIMLIKKGKLDLDEKVSAYLGHHAWYLRIPNASSITVRQIMNHTSGVMRYEFKPDFVNDLNAMPAKEWKPEELLKYVWDENPGFAAGQGWDYSNTNYILLGMIIEQLTGKRYYELLYKEILEPRKRFFCHQFTSLPLLLNR